MSTKFKALLTLFLVLMSQIIFAQERTVSGKVSDQSGLPLPGVSVVEKGTTNGTQTDLDGNYQLKTKANATLQFSFIGMKSQEVKVTSNTMNVKLEDEAKVLEGVVVTALGIKREKKSLGYAETTVKKEELTRVVNTNPFESLSGKVAGIDISSPGQPGASPKMIVRGIGSITGTNAPLFVVDGSVIDASMNGSTSTTRSFDGGSGISDLDPNNIESITFLKGAAASALYGSRAGNGVILITTKKGKNKSKINVELVNSLEFSEVARVPHLQNTFGQGWNGLGYSQVAGFGAAPSNENGSWGPAFNGEIRPWGTVYNNSQQIKPYVGLEDNVRDFYDTGILTTNNININGGSDNTDFSLTFSNLVSDGIIPTDADKYVKRNLGFNGGLKNDKFSMRLSLNYTNRDQNAVNTGQGDDAGEGSTLQQDLLQIPRDISIVDLADYTNNPFNSPSYYFTPYATNPYWAINENSTKIMGHNFFGNINFDYKITSALSANFQYGGNYRNDNIKSYGAIVNYLAGSPQDLAHANPVVGGVTESRIERAEVETYLRLTYDKTFSEKWRFNATGGIYYNQRESNSLQASITGLDVPNFYEISNSPNRPEIAQNNVLRKTFAAFAQAELAFNNKYFLTLSGRNDWTSTLPVANAEYFYPAASLSAVVIDNGSSFLKLRASASEIANDTGAYQTESSLVQGNAAANFGVINAPLGGINFYEYSGILGNNELKPERVREFEFGIEGNFFTNRVRYDLSYYHSKTRDLIVAIPLDPSTGFNSKASNIGDVVNKGIELTLGFTPIKNDNFKWDLNYTFTKNDNEMTRVEGTDRIEITDGYGVTFGAQEGLPIGSYFAYVPVTNAAGQYVVNPDTGYYVRSAEEEYIGDSQRDFVMGLQNTFTYKDFSLSFALDWKQGGEMYSYTKRLSHFVGNGIETLYNDRNPFIIPNSVNDNGDGTYSENTTPVSFENVTNFWGNTSNNPVIERGHIIDKTFIRMRDISLYYSLPAKLTERMGLTKLTFGLYGKNLFMWTPDENPYVDPETTTYGNDLLSEFGEFGTNPSQRAYGASIKLSF